MSFSLTLHVKNKECLNSVPQRTVQRQHLMFWAKVLIRLVQINNHRYRLNATAYQTRSPTQQTVQSTAIAHRKYHIKAVINIRFKLRFLNNSTRFWGKCVCGLLWVRTMLTGGYISSRRLNKSILGLIHTLSVVS